VSDSTGQDIQARLERLFDKFERLSDTEIAMLRAVWESVDGSEREEAWVHAKEIVRARRLDSLLDDSRGRLAAWVNNDPFIGITGGSLLPAHHSGMKPASIRHMALPPMLDAIVATLTSVDLTSSEATVLLEPINSIVARPRR
jgi:hypothetical protein